MTEYEEKYNNMLSAMKRGENPFKRSDQVENWYKELDNEKFKCEIIYQERMRRNESEDKDNHFQLWSENVLEDNNLDYIFCKNTNKK